MIVHILSEVLLLSELRISSSKYLITVHFTFSHALKLRYPLHKVIKTAIQIVVQKKLEQRRRLSVRSKAVSYITVQS